MKKLKIGLLACIACMALVGCLAFTACKKTPTFAIEWKLDDHVTVVADGYDKLPEKVKEGTEIFFTATPDNGYEISSVAPSSIKKDGQKYKFTVTKDFSVTVKVAKGIESVTAELKEDANRVYYAGETIEAEDITVSVKYKTGETEIVTSGFYFSYENEGEALAIGDSEVTVTYRNIDAKIELPLLDDEDGVVALVTIDTDGGALTQAYQDKIKTFAHYNYDDETGIATFTHKGLSEAIALPALGTNNVNGEVTKGLEGDYILRGWNGSETLTSIPKSTVESVTYKLTSSPVLLIINKIYYVIEEVPVTPSTGDGAETQADETEQVPYLVIKGEFKLAESAYLFLYEGNAKVELKGDTITKNAEDRNFELKFDMRKLVDSETDFKGKWMDIKFVTVIKEAETEEEEDEKLTQEIILEDYADIVDFCNTKQVINVGNYDYGFKTFESNGRTYLKAVYEDAAVYSFTLEAGTVTEGEGDTAVTLPTLVINGQIAATQLEKYKGKAVKIDFNNGAWIAPIDQNGAWTLTITLRVEGDKAIAYGTDGYGHFSIIEAVDNDTLLYKDGKDGNFLNKCCTDGLSAIADRTGLSSVLTGDAIRIANEDNSQVFYIGEGKWGGLIATARNEKEIIISLNGVKLEAGKMTVTQADPENEGETIEVEQDVAYLVFTGTWKYFVEHTFDAEADLEALKNAFTQHFMQSAMTPDNYASIDNAQNSKGANSVFKIYEDGTFELKLALNGVESDKYYYVSLKFGGKSNGDTYASDFANIDRTEVVVGGLKFSIHENSEKAPDGAHSWTNWRLLVHVETVEGDADAE